MRTKNACGGDQAGTSCLLGIFLAPLRREPATSFATDESATLMFAMLLLWSRGALSCSEPCTHDLEAWRAHKLEQLKYAQTEASGAPREHMETRRTGLLGTVCPRLRHEGVHCSQLLRSVRGANAWLLEHLLNFTVVSEVLRLACGRATSATFFFDTGHEEARTF